MTNAQTEQIEAVQNTAVHITLIFFAACLTWLRYLQQIWLLWPLTKAKYQRKSFFTFLNLLLDPRDNSIISRLNNLRDISSNVQSHQTLLLLYKVYTKSLSEQYYQTVTIWMNNLSYHIYTINVLIIAYFNSSYNVCRCSILFLLSFIQYFLIVLSSDSAFMAARMFW